jgi:hypothetical protein
MIEALACGTRLVPELVTDGATALVRSDEGGLVDALRRSTGWAGALRKRQPSGSTERMVDDHLRLYERPAETSSLRRARLLTTRITARICAATDQTVRSVKLRGHAMPTDTAERSPPD